MKNNNLYRLLFFYVALILHFTIHSQRLFGLEQAKGCGGRGRKSVLIRCTVSHGARRLWSRLRTDRREEETSS
ncbi:hypothetical protein ATH33_1347 [Thermoactinomyces vulgaris]|nr:hypothetical protein ATH33_1347 [Thermoactinomyces vulgaris]